MSRHNRDQFGSRKSAFPLDAIVVRLEHQAEGVVNKLSRGIAFKFVEKVQRVISVQWAWPPSAHMLNDQDELPEPAAMRPGIHH